MKPAAHHRTMGSTTPTTALPGWQVAVACTAVAAPAAAQAGGGRSGGCVWLVVLAALLALAAIKAAVEVLSLRRHGVHAGALGIALWGFDFLLIVTFVVAAGAALPLLTPEPAQPTGRPVELLLWMLLGLGFLAVACLVETAVLGMLLRRSWARPALLPDVPLSARALTAVAGNLGFLLLGLAVGTGSCLRGLQ